MSEDRLDEQVDDLIEQLSDDTEKQADQPEQQARSDDDTEDDATKIADQEDDGTEEESEQDDEASVDTAEEVRRSVMEMIAKAQAANQQQQKQQQAVDPRLDVDKDVPIVQGQKFELPDDVVEEAMTDPAKLKEVLKTVHKNAVESTLRSVLPAVNEIVTRQLQIKTLVDNFYRENEDLAPYKEFVGFVANVVASEHPDWDYSKVLEETAKISRQKLLLEKKTEKQKKSSTKRYKPSAARQQPAKLSELEQEILDLIS